MVVLAVNSVAVSQRKNDGSLAVTLVLAIALSQALIDFFVFWTELEITSVSVAE